MAALKYKQQENESVSRIIKLSNIKLCNNYENHLFPSKYPKKNLKYCYHDCLRFIFYCQIYISQDIQIHRIFGILKYFMYYDFFWEACKHF